MGARRRVKGSALTVGRSYAKNHGVISLLDICKVAVAVQSQSAAYAADHLACSGLRKLAVQLQQELRGAAGSVLLPSKMICRYMSLNPFAQAMRMRESG